jgi:hypothetical protein
MLAVVVLGAVLLLLPRDAQFEIVPFPGPGLSVKLLADVRSSGQYYLRLDIPKADQALGLGADTISCPLVVTLTSQSGSPIRAELSSFARYGEFGFGKVQYYRGNTSWQLHAGEHTVEISSPGPCDTITQRGGAVSLEQEVTHPTERYLWATFRHSGGIVCLAGGLIALLILEFTRA